MALPLPTSLSPSKVSSFKDCALAFRYSAIDKLPEPPSLPAVKGTTVHRALELLFQEPPEDRTPERAQACLDAALVEMATDEDHVALGLTADEQASFAGDAARMVERYFTLEDPRTVRPTGLELMLETQLGSLTVRGIIDRLELDGAGDLVVTDYKTGRAPSATQEQSRLGGVHFYAFLCERVLGHRPAKVQLIYLGNQPQVITTTPSERSIAALERKLGAVWTAIERACDREDFRPRPSALCSWCSFRDYCPAAGGDPALVPTAVAAPVSVAPQPALDLAAGA